MGCPSGSRRRYEPWERQPYHEFPNRVLILGGGFAGYTAAKTLCRLARHRDDVGVMLISRENYFTFWPMLAGAISSDIETKNIAQAVAEGPDPGRRQLPTRGGGEHRPREAMRYSRRAGVPLRPFDSSPGRRARLLRHPGVEEVRLSA